MITLREGILATVCVAIVATTLLHKPQPAQVAEVKTTQDDKIVRTNETTKKSKVTVTQTVKPDGTKTTTTITEKDLSQVKQKSDDKSSSVDVTTPVAPEKTKYSVDVSYEPAITRAPQPTDVNVGGSVRVADSDFWVTGGYSVKNNQVRVGVRYEF